MFANRSPTLANRSLLSAPGNGFQEAETGGAETRKPRASAQPETQDLRNRRAKPLNRRAVWQSRARDPLGAECVVGAAGLEPTTRPLSAAGSNLCEQRRRGQETNGRRQRRFVFKSSPSAAHSKQLPSKPCDQKGERFRGFWLEPGVEDPLDQLRLVVAIWLRVPACARPMIMKYLVSALGFEPRTY